MTASLSVRLEHLQALAELARTSLPLGINSISTTPDGVLSIARSPRPSQVRFHAENLLFHVLVSPDGEATISQIWAEIGFVPYTVQSPERRRAVLTILRRTASLPHVRFVIDNSQKILVMSEDRIERGLTPGDLAWQATMMIQESRPFLRLLAEYL